MEIGRGSLYVPYDLKCIPTMPNLGVMTGASSDNLLAFAPTMPPFKGCTQYYSSSKPGSTLLASHKARTRNSVAIIAEHLCTSKTRTNTIQVPGVFWKQVPKPVSSQFQHTIACHCLQSCPCTLDKFKDAMVCSSRQTSNSHRGCCCRGLELRDEPTQWFCL